MNIQIAKPVIGHEEVAAVSDVLMSGMLVQGERVAAFERVFADYCGTAYAVATSNGTTALHAALLAAGIGPGDEVIVPAFSFIASASSVSMCGAAPVFCDVDETTFTLDPGLLEKLVTPKTKAVIGVHLFGQPFDVTAVLEFCEARNLMLIEDAAQAHGAIFRGGRVGGFGRLGCFSFYATKNIVTGEGGMAVTNDRALAERIRLLINHGQTGKYLHSQLGYNYRMTDIAAAIGLVQVKKLEKFNARRRRNAEYLTTHLRCRGIIAPAEAPGTRHVYHQYVIRLTDELPMTRQVFVDYLKGKGIMTAIHYPVPLHRQPLYAPAADPDPCPVSTRLAASVLSLPVHPLLDEKELAYMCEMINRVG